MHKIRRSSQTLDVEGLRELLDLPAHEVRALIADNQDPDDFRHHLFARPLRRRHHAPLRARKEAR